MNTTMNRSILIGTIATALLLVAAVSAMFWLRGGTKTVAAAAQHAYETCVSSGNKEACYEEAIAPLYPELTLPQVFDVIRAVRRLDRSYQFCHLLAHQLGEMAVAENPERWIDVVPLNPEDGLCSNGFIHGAVIGRFRDDVLTGDKLARAIEDFAIACEPRDDWRPTDLDRAICYHGLGHLYTFVTNAALQDAANICEETANKPTGDFRRVCREGVFMQIYQPVEPDDFDLIELLPVKPTAENYRDLCGVYALPEERGACLREAWPLFREAIFNDGYAGAFCAHQPNKNEEDACFDAITSIVGRFSLNDPGKLAKTCLSLPEERQQQCFNRSALAALEEDRGAGGLAMNLCATAPEHMRGACLGFIADRASFVFGPGDARISFCESLPAEYQARCTRP